MGFLALVGVGTCSSDDMSHFSLGSASYANMADCKQVLSGEKPIHGVVFKKFTNAVGTRVPGVACHSVNLVADAKSGNLEEGGL